VGRPCPPAGHGLIDGGMEHEMRFSYTCRQVNRLAGGGIECSSTHAFLAIPSDTIPHSADPQVTHAATILKDLRNNEESF